MLARAKQRAKAKGIDFDLTEDLIHIPAFCPVLMIPLIVGDIDHAPSLDRITNTRGYVPGNILVISNRANRMKNNATPAEMMLLARFYERL